MGEDELAAADQSTVLDRLGANGLVRTFAVLLISALFLIVLTIASAQQQAVNALAAARSTDSFSVASRKLSEAKENRQQRTELIKANRDLTAANANLTQQIVELDGQAYSASNELGTIARQINSSGRCPALSTSMNTTATALSTDGLWQEVLACVREGDAPTKAMDAFHALEVPEKNPEQLRRSLILFNSQISANKQQIESNAKQIDDLSKEIESSREVQNAFQDIELLQTNWVFGVTGLAYLPPSIMQIFLCFLSGLFGALLLTLILIVYPNSELKSAGTASFWNRIFLGGLTAVGAFVMIGGGVAVISSSDTLFNGRSNFMSFCAIGILAGMFSDRVAKWLSRTATTMFDKQPDPPDGQSNGQTANGAAT